MKAVLDACVLYPTILREILIGAADAGLYQSVWSPRILAEWQHAAARLGPDQASVAGAEIAMLRLAHPAAEVPDDGDRAIDFDWPDPADRHVAEAALAAGADAIITANLRDFPRSLMGSLGLTAIHPDAFLLDLYRQSPAPIADAVHAAHAKAVALGGDLTLKDLMSRARLPRVFKAIRDK